ncbi:MAG: DNA polymerase IV [Candidatus Levybacteria bacterium]|nr:DNA polymerase IV [Candidatus Levybacteria bacterium]
MEKIILHIDFDSFFASAEQQFNPKLRGKPMGVTAANGRTCIIASSREAKKLGIKTGTRSWEAYKLCPQLILVKADFVKYLQISKKFLNICKDYSPYVELFSIDELFMDITHSSHLFSGAYGIIEKIKKRIKEEIGECITVSVGISHNKLLAKLSSGLKKPNGVFEIDTSNLDEVYKNAELTDICGIGDRINERLNKIGIHNLMDLRKATLPFLVSEFGNCEGHFLKNVSLGIDDSLVNPYTNPVNIKSVGRNYCLPQNEYDKKIVMQNIYELCEEVGIKLRRLGKKARTIGVSLRGSFNIHGQKTCKEYFDTGKEIFSACLSLSSSHLPGGNSVYVRQISIWVSNLENKINIPPSLFDSVKKNKLTCVIDEINEKFGDHTIRNGFLLYSEKLTTAPNGYMADKYERTKLAMENI